MGKYHYIAADMIDLNFTQTHITEGHKDGKYH